MMKQSLQLGLSQHLTMTPQLQQAIKLLQLSTLDLQQEIQQILDSNMMIEVSEELIEEDAQEDQKEEKLVEITQDIPAELDNDASWDDIYDEPGFSRSLLPLPQTIESSDFELQQRQVETLQDYLRAQLALTSLSSRDYAIAIAIIDAINPEGYLSIPPQAIYEGLVEQIDALSFDELMAVLHCVQNFDPVGIGAIDIADGLRLQLQALPPSTAYRKLAIELVRSALNLLELQEKSKLIKKLNINEYELAQVVKLIRSLDPMPGRKIATFNLDYVIPDVFVSKHQKKWRIKLNADMMPKLRVNPYYSSLIKRADSSADNTSMKNHLQEAKWFIKSLHGRNETLLRVAQCIVEKQAAFLESGAMAMKPMILKDIADELELHESTISRVTTQKYMHTPNGIVEFKYFFSSHVATRNGGACSATAIRAFIKELVANEVVSKPLSDEKISVILQEKGIKIARRTVAKYREALSIASSSQRKRLL